MSDPPKPTLEELYPLPDPAVIEANRKKRQERQRARWKLEAERRERAKIPVPHLGVAAYFTEPVWKDQTKAERLAPLLVDPRWPWAPCWMRFTARDKRKDSKSIRVGGKHGAAPLVSAMRRDDLFSIGLNRSSGTTNHCTVMLTVADYRPHTWASSIWMTCKSIDLPAGKSIAGFLALTHDVLNAVEAETAVIGVWPTVDQAIGDTWLTRTILDTPGRDVNLGLPANYDAQMDLVSRFRHELGRAYARFPRWGTYLHAGHLAAIGGLERVRAVVDPAVVQPVGALTYLQLTPSVDSAQSPEAEAKRRALEELMAPILPGTTEPSTAP